MAAHDEEFVGTAEVVPEATVASTTMDPGRMREQKKLRRRRVPRHPKQPGKKKRSDYTPEEVVTLTEEYAEKNAYLRLHFRQLTPREFYRGLFPEGSFEQFRDVKTGKEERESGEDRRPNGILSVLSDPDRRGWSYNRLLFDDLSSLDDVAGKEFVIASPIGFSGRKRTSRMAYQFFGMAIDLDDVGVDNLKDLFLEIENEILPWPTYVVNSGTGMHIYYAFEYPVPAHPCLYPSFNTLKKALTSMIWNRYTSRDKNKQFQGIFQGYRVPGTQSKFSAECLVTAFETGKKVTVNYLNSFVDKDERADFNDFDYTSRREAKEMWADWYERRINRKERVGEYVLTAEQRKRRRRWYESWKDKMRKGAFDGNRHYCVGVLFNYAMKAGIPYEEALEYALSQVPYLNSLTNTPGNEFTDDDVYAASIYYDGKFIKMGRKGIQRMTSIDIGVTKRNGRSRDEHIKVMQAIRDIDYPDGSWRNKNGAPKKEEIVQKWKEKHPLGTKAECQRATGLDPKTVRKWWNPEDEKKNAENLVKERRLWLQRVSEIEMQHPDWHKDLPKYYVVEGEDMFSDMQQFISKGIKSIEILTSEEEGFLLEKKRMEKALRLPKNKNDKKTADQSE